MLKNSCFICFLFASSLFITQCKARSTKGGEVGAIQFDQYKASAATVGTEKKLTSPSEALTASTDNFIPIPLADPKISIDPVVISSDRAVKISKADDALSRLTKSQFINQTQTQTETSQSTQVAVSTSTMTLSSVQTMTSLQTNTNTQQATQTNTNTQQAMIRGNDGSGAFDLFYQKILNNNGIYIIASASVADDALIRAKYVVDAMLTYLPDVRQAMQTAQYRINVIGRNQILTDLPDFSYLLGHSSTETGSVGIQYSTLRGLGGRTALAIGEENLLCDTVQMFPYEDVAVHEFAHSIKIYMSSQSSGRIDTAYNSAKNNQLYTPTIYMMANSQEYWAEATQSWFGVTLRIDVNDHFNTRARLSAHDPGITSILNDVFKDVVILPYSATCRY